eukprot:1308291-Pyramimonas_sp.AAC.1
MPWPLRCTKALRRGPSLFLTSAPSPQTATAAERRGPSAYSPPREAPWHAATSGYTEIGGVAHIATCA